MNKIHIAPWTKYNFIVLNWICLRWDGNENVEPLDIMKAKRQYTVIKRKLISEYKNKKQIAQEEENIAEKVVKTTISAQPMGEIK